MVSVLPYRVSALQLLLSVCVLCLCLPFRPPLPHFVISRALSSHPLYSWALAIITNITLSVSASSLIATACIVDMDMKNRNI